MKILKQLQSLLSMMGVYQNLSLQQITKYEVYLHEPVHCTTVTSLYNFQKLSFHSSTQTRQHHNLKKKMPTLKQGSRKKRPNQLSGTSRFPSRQANVLAYMLTGQSPRQATFQSNQAGLQIIFLDTYRYSETNLPPHTM